MKYSVEIERNIDAVTYCLRKIGSVIDSYDWRISAMGGGIDYGIYLNVDIENKELEICNQPRYKEMDSLDEIIELIEEEYSEE